MIERFRRHLTTTGLFPERGLALVAVSGGPDSVALLRLLHAVAGDFGLDLSVAHIDHGIHADSAPWAEGVRALAEALAVPVYIERLGLGAGTGETVAREARYAALERLRIRLGARYVVTAHHADDQVETVLFRILRGSAPAGLAGMAPVRNHLVRPLLPFRRADLAPFAVGAIVDPANVDPAHDRSWIRTDLLPRLRRQFGAQLDENILTLAEHAAADRLAWEAAAGLVPGLRAEIAPGVVRCSRKALAALSSELGAAVVRGLARKAGLVLRPRHAARLIAFLASAEGGRRLELGGGLTVGSAGGVVTIQGPGED